MTAAARRRLAFGARGVARRRDAAAGPGGPWRRAGDGVLAGETRDGGRAVDGELHACPWLRWEKSETGEKGEDGMRDVCGWEEIRWASCRAWVHHGHMLTEGGGGCESCDPPGE